MTVAQAYQRLQIRDQSLDDQGVIVSYISCVRSPGDLLNLECRLSERPGDVERGLTNCWQGSQ
jgi:hypothetical protein